MREVTGQYKGPMLVIHGGAGPQDPKAGGGKAAIDELREIAAGGSQLLEKNSGADIIRYCVKAMEDSERFNAGLGSALQADGMVRQTASFMSGEEQKFSGVIGATYVKNPIDIAIYNQARRSRVVGPPGSELLAREIGAEVRFNLTERRLDRFVDQVKTSTQQWDTVGCVVRDHCGRLWAGTSTGGRGFEFPGRVSDSGTVAGNYASKVAAVAATGIGEEIVDDGLCVRVEGRMRDGMGLGEANRRCFVEAVEARRQYGWICVDGGSNWGIFHTTNTLPCVAFGLDGEIPISQQ